MWGQIMTEVSYQPNFNITFSNTKADVLIHLSQWQYWWWFWFNLVWVLYFFILIRVLRFRTLKFHPKIASSTRPHGKWGDLIICALPLCWCTNILINSNFLLKMVEWQNESNLFTLRIRGKQWYWVYKIDTKGLLETLTSKRNIGHNNWSTSVGKDSNEHTKNISFLQTRLSTEWYQDYIKDLDTKDTKKNKQHLLSPVEYPIINYKNENLFSLNCYTSNVLSSNLLTNLDNNNNILLFNRYKMSFESNFKVLNKHFDLMLNKTKLLYCKNMPLNISIIKTFTDKNIFFDNKLIIKSKKNIKLNKSFFNIFDLQNKLTGLNANSYNDFIENSRAIHRPAGVKNTLRLLKLPITSNNISKNIQFLEKNNLFDNYITNLEENTMYNFTNYILTHNLFENIQINKTNINISLLNKWFMNKFIYANNLDLYKSVKNPIFKLKFNNNINLIQPKDSPDNLYYVIKQKRYSRKRDIQNSIFNKERTLTTKDEFLKKPVFRSIKKLEDSTMNYTRQYRMFKKSKKKHSNIPVTLSKRLLRTNKVLVLPAHVNITAITNSYDVVHSWFVPGLGLKIDCIPGRSTHHTFFIDNVGFYYGQCAEVCGRYHHHMPIKLCAIPLNHFFLWWHASALPKMIYPTKGKDLAVYYTSKKFSW